jgi:antirestriction protein ArdC
MTKNEQQEEALFRARNGQSGANLPAVYLGFEAMGIPLEDIKPRDNVLTYGAWRALGRTVRKGEHGVKVLTWIPIDGKLNTETGEREPGGKRCKSATVFHVSQTDELTERAAS